MAVDQNQENIHIIMAFRDRLRRLIQIEPVLDQLHFIDHEQKEKIRAKLQAQGNLCAAGVLIDTIINNKHPEGWFRELLVALEGGGCKQAANYIENSPPSPSIEAENDSCIQLINLLGLSLVKMKTADVCLSCFTMGLLTEEDRENILAEMNLHGNTRGARLLLRRVVRNPVGWFSQFLSALEDTGHPDLVRELRGEPLNNEDDGPDKSDTPGVLKDESECSPVMDAEKTRPEAEAEDSSIYNTEDTSMSNSMDSSFCLSSLDTSLDTIPENRDLDLYNDEKLEADHLEDSLDQSDCGAEGAVSRETDIALRDYQMAVARPALEGKNIIICLPTGSGKTRVAVYITKEHLDSRKRKQQPGKVVVLVNKVPLVEQHYKAEFGKFLKNQYKVERVSGDSQLKISFPDIVKKNDIIICTAQILENSFKKAKNGDDDGVQLSQFSLVVIDECHHTQKGGVYNHIMIRYLKQKHRNPLLVKEQKEPLPLPQILGLTASPGVGGAKTQHKAEEHILRICANLDAFTIKTRSMGEENKLPYKRIASAEPRKEDPFGDVIKDIMDEIHAHAELNPLCDPGTQNYEQWVVQREQNAAKEQNQKLRVCAEHLRQYNEALHQGNTIRMSDACSFLDKFYREERRKKFNPEEEGIKITDTERFLFKLFDDKKEKLQELAKHPEYENKILSKLRKTILQEFTGRDEARGIIFTKTRLSAIALSQWIQENRKFEEAGVRASHLIGGGDQSVVKPMTSAEQKDVLSRFRSGEINLLIATTVAEEGLDIKECNVVIRYCLVTNEIAMIQARGRGRAEDSSYTLVEEEGSGVAERESVNEYREKMMSKAIDRVMKLNRADYEKKIKDFQIQAIMEEKVRTKKKKQKGMLKEDPSKVKFSCRNCMKPVCSGEHIEIIENMHHVNVSTQFSELFNVRENTSLQERRLDYEANGVIACNDCGQPWGSIMLYRGIECPCLHIKNFVVTYNMKKKVFSKWNELAIRFPAFDYAEHAHMVAESSEDEDDDYE
ncbi:interferon-induced helicase C domain-containing protein 1 [Chanos chanos]|uniref:RNA helicase n=1 Tax=Chanos chanos TaxID=29144 RepID=A0A6J2WED6_CHACN|nr:interferon-induced helicase C domain-containing protein 1 [Chanos chanos]